MPQTLLALLALVLASFLTFNQQRLTTRSQQNIITSELELAAAGVASEVMAIIEAKAFDEESTPQAIYAAQEVPSSPSEFTQGSGFGAADRGTAGCNFSAPLDTPDCDDVDDVDGIGWTPYTIELARQVYRDPVTGKAISKDSVYTRELHFEVRSSVYYVDNPESMVEAAGRTLHKRLLLDIRSPMRGYDDDGLVRFTRVISYDPIKAEMDYENTEGYGPIGSETGGTSTNENASDSSTN